MYICVMYINYVCVLMASVVLGNLISTASLYIAFHFTC